jgi:hypothetical protein
MQECGLGFWAVGSLQVLIDMTAAAGAVAVLGLLVQYCSLGCGWCQVHGLHTQLCNEVSTQLPAHTVCVLSSWLVGVAHD